MKITLTIPDNIATRVIHGVAKQHGYKSVIINTDGVETPNPESEAQFAKRVIIQDIKRAVRSWEATQAAETARLAATESADSEINIT